MTRMKKTNTRNTYNCVFSRVHISPHICIYTYRRDGACRNERILNYRVTVLRRQHIQRDEWLSTVRYFSQTESFNSAALTVTFSYAQQRRKSAIDALHRYNQFPAIDGRADGLAGRHIVSGFSSPRAGCTEVAYYT